MLNQIREIYIKALEDNTMLNPAEAAFNMADGEALASIMNKYGVMKSSAAIRKEATALRIEAIGF